jgi:ferredoxin-NADP reductase
MGSAVPTRLVYSSRTLDDVIYRDELETLAASGEGVDVVYTFTREPPPGWAGYARRVDIDLLREVAFPPQQEPRVFVCGPTSFVEAVADSLVVLGDRPGRVRTERFGGG